MASLIYTLPFILSAIAIVVFGIYIIRRKAIEGVNFKFFVIVCTIWALTDGLGIALDDIQSKILLAELRAIFLVWTEFLLFLVTMQVLGKLKWRTGPRLWAFASIPIVTSIIAITNEWTGLLYQGKTLIFNGFTNVYAFQPGPWSIVYTVFIFAVPAAYLTMISLALWANRNSSLHQTRQMVLQLFALALPLIGAIAYMVVLDPNGYFVPTSGMIGITIVILAYSHPKYGFLDLAPIARSELVDMISDMMLVLDNEGRVVDMNQRMGVQIQVDNKGAPNDRSIGRVLEKSWPELLSAIEGGENRREVSLHKDGTDLVFEYSIESLTYDKQGQVGKIILLRDITEKKQNEIRLNQSEKRFRTLVDCAQFPVLIFDLESDRILYANASLYTLFRLYQGEQPNGHMFADPEDRIRTLEKLGRTGVINDKEVRLRRNDGSTFWAVASVSMVDFEGRNSLLATFNDISPLVKARDELDMANRRLTLVSSITNHDLMNKLSVTSGYLELLRKGVDGMTGLNYLDKIDRATKEAEYLIQFTRDYQKEQIGPPRWHSIGEAFREVWGQLDTRDVVLDINIGEIELFSDSMFSKVIYNLIDNSLRYGETISRINLEYEIVPEGLALRYGDDGVGILAENKEKIFERGFGKNTGLGLGLCRDILWMTNMTIKEQGEPGKGAQFEILIPNGSYRLGPE